MERGGFRVRLGESDKISRKDWGELRPSMKKSRGDVDLLSLISGSRYTLADLRPSVLAYAMFNLSLD